MSNTKNTRLFEAKTMQEALRIATHSLGEEAMIVESGENENGVWLMVSTGEETINERDLPQNSASAFRLLIQFLEEVGFSDRILTRFASFIKTNTDTTENLADQRSFLVNFFDLLLAERPSPFDFDAALASKHPACFFLVGATGQGKTVTTAKLAVSLMRQGAFPVVASLDVEKSGGTVQLETLLKTLRIPVHVKRTQEDIHALLEKTAPHTPVLIDTPGLNLFCASDRSFIGKWKQWTKGNAFGLLRAGGDIRETKAILNILKEEGVTRVGTTHCDATRYLGTVLSALFSSDMTLEFLCDSPFISCAPRVALADNIVDSLISSGNLKKDAA
ncbi:MAG: hypothetical protein LBD15_00635 [Holosporales bacterium]|jgi:flagellar biosynthesis GTPase FlhF|nr:hypothetical protein [Holosporales bacterium]